MRPVRYLCCILAVIAIAGCDDEKWKKPALAPEEVAEKAYAPKPERTATLHVSGEAITCDDILAEPITKDNAGETFKDKLIGLARDTTLAQFMEFARPQMRQRLNNNISTVVLYKQAKRELGDKADETLDKLVDEELRRFTLRHGGNDAQADEALKKIGMTRTTFKASMRRTILAQYALKMPKERPITHGELVACYDQMKGESFAVAASVQFRLIDIQPDRVDVADPNENRIDKARALADALTGRIKAGGDFAALAQVYSHGMRKEEGGLWPPRDPNAFVSPYDAIAAKAIQMEVGQVAGPIEVPGHLFIVKLEQKQAKGYRPLQEVQSQVEEKIMDDRYDEALHKFDAEITAQTAMVDVNGFLDRCLEQIYNQARTTQR
jgi:parvulin-like peptidyl-prolyl isomerase